MTIVVTSTTLDADYSWLKSTISDFLHRTDLADKIPNFIYLAELEINRRLGIFPREVEVPISAISGSRFVPLPSDFGSPIALYSSHVEPRYEFVAAIPEQLRINNDQLGLPRYFAIDGINIAFDRKVDQAYPLQFRYMQTLFLSSTNSTNAVFQRSQDVYLYGALSHAAPYIKDDERLPMWTSLYRTLLNSAAADAARSKSVAPLRTEIPESLFAAANTRRDWRY